MSIYTYALAPLLYCQPSPPFFLLSPTPPSTFPALASHCFIPITSKPDPRPVEQAGRGIDKRVLGGRVPEGNERGRRHQHAWRRGPERKRRRRQRRPRRKWRRSLRRVQVPPAQVRERVHLRALLRLGAGRGALRGGAQGVRRQQRLQTAAPDPGVQAPRRRRHHLLRGPGTPPRPRLRMRRPHLRAPAAGGESPGGADLPASPPRHAGAAVPAAAAGPAADADAGPVLHLGPAVVDQRPNHRRSVGALRSAAAATAVGGPAAAPPPSAPTAAPASAADAVCRARQGRLRRGRELGRRRRPAGAGEGAPGPPPVRRREARASAAAAATLEIAGWRGSNQDVAEKEVSGMETWRELARGNNEGDWGR